MKNLSLTVFAAFLAVIALCGCQPDPASEGWLKHTTWKADMAGKTVTEVFDDSEFDNTVREGSILIKFSGNGYSMNVDLDYVSDSPDYNGGFYSRTITKLFPDYDYPELQFPFVVGGSKDNPEIEYSTGIISEDLKSIYFESFYLSKGSTIMGPIVAKDITFTR